jgi:hypothetical protein
MQQFPKIHPSKALVLLLVAALLAFCIALAIQGHATASHYVIPLAIGLLLLVFGLWHGTVDGENSVRFSEVVRDYMSQEGWFVLIFLLALLLFVALP